jgi:hypothetical protein
MLLTQIINVAKSVCNGRSVPHQPWLFPDIALADSFVSDDDLRLAAKAVIDKELKVRRSLAGPELLFVDELNKLIEHIRSLSRLSDTQREELVLYSIERQGATTFDEIAGDTRLHVSVVKEIVEKLKTDGRLTTPKKYIPGSDRSYPMFKSSRQAIPEAG